MQQFADPASGDVVKPEDVLGHLLIVRPTELRPQVPTSFGATDAIVCDVADLDANTIATNVMWFPKVLVGSLTSNVGKLVLARMGQGQAKPGQSAPWILTPESSNPQSVERAQKFLELNPTFNGFAAPAAAAAPAQPATAAAPATPATPATAQAAGIV